MFLVVQNQFVATLDGGVRPSFISSIQISRRAGGREPWALQRPAIRVRRL